MKKMIALVLCLVLAMSLAACGGESDPTTVPTTAPTTVPTTAPTTAPTEPAAVDVKAIYDACKAQMPEMIDLDADMMLDYCGIRAEDCVSAYVAICADGLLTDEIWIIEAANAEALQNLLDMCDARLEAKAEESETYSPKQYAVVQDAVVLTSRNYLAVLVSPDVDALEATVKQGLGIE